MLLSKLWWKITTIITVLVAKRRGIKVGRQVRCLGLPVITAVRGSQIEIGDRVVLVSDVRGTALGVSGPTILRTLSSGGKLRIGDDTGISGGVICAAESVSIGKRCLLGADVMIFDTDFHNHEPEGRRYKEPKWSKISRPVVIEDDVFIGTRTIISKGVTIGAGSIIAAGSIVTTDVAPRSIYAGVPAKFKRNI